jgi:ribonuclease HII
MSLSLDKLVVGVDEAGRGPLAGPVSVGVVRSTESLDLVSLFPGLNDSKKMTEKARERVFVALEEQQRLGVIDFCVEFRSAQDIDTNGIAVVIREAVALGVEKMLPKPSQGKVWLDGSLSAPNHYEQETVIKGDSIIPAIMLASVAAKVMRDRFMVEIAQKYPAYGFEKHKGYGTASHIGAIKKVGQCDLHRKTFIHFD